MTTLNQYLTYWRSIKMTAAQKVIKTVLDALAQWSTLAEKVGVSPTTRQLIQQQLDKVRLDNQALLVGM